MGWGSEEPHTYETGYREGEVNAAANWHIALTEHCELPPRIDSQDPESVAKYIHELQQQVEAPVSRARADPSRRLLHHPPAMCHYCGTMGEGLICWKCDGCCPPRADHHF